jgi:hypothetical protein
VHEDLAAVTAPDGVLGLARPRVGDGPFVLAEPLIVLGGQEGAQAACQRGIARRRREACAVLRLVGPPVAQRPVSAIVGVMAVVR